MVDMLIAHGHDVSAFDAQQRTPLFCAVIGKAQSSETEAQLSQLAKTAASKHSVVDYDDVDVESDMDPPSSPNALGVERKAGSPVYVSSHLPVSRSSAGYLPNNAPLLSLLLSLLSLSHLSPPRSVFP